MQSIVIQSVAALNVPALDQTLRAALGERFFGFTYANVAEAEIDYSEARVGVRPLSWLRASVTYANTDARDGATDVALARRPRHAWSAELAVEHGPLTAELSWREVGARLDTAGQAPQHGVQAAGMAPVQVLEGAHVARRRRPHVAGVLVEERCHRQSGHPTAIHARSDASSGRKVCTARRGSAGRAPGPGSGRPTPAQPRHGPSRRARLRDAGRPQALRTAGTGRHVRAAAAASITVASWMSTMSSTSSA